MKMQQADFSRDLAELNEGFLWLVARGSDAGLTSAVHARLRTLEREPRQRLAALPFALFGFGFQEEAAWANLLSPGVRDLEPRYAPVDPSIERFTLLALTALRSFVRAAPQRISAWIGLPPETGSRLASLEISALGEVAAAASPRLRGRLAVEEFRWLCLIDACERNDARQLALLAAFGHQWTIRRALRIESPRGTTRGFRR
jgi:hypothetical protein